MLRFVSRSLALLSLLLPRVGSAASADVEKARRLFYDKKPGEAAKAVEAGLHAAGNTRETLIDLYELKGIALAELGQQPKAIEAFLDLLELDPVHELTGKYPAKVTAAFKQSRKQQGEGLEIKPAKAGLDAKGRIIQVAVKVKNDERHLVERVVFHVATDGGPMKEEDGEVQGLYAALSLDAAAVDWWAEVRGANDAVLAKIGSAEQPVSEGQGAKGGEGFEKTGKPAEAKSSDKPAETKTAENKDAVPPPPKEKEKEKEKEGGGLPSITEEPSSSPLRPTGYVLAGLGVVALGVGTYFGITSNNDRNTLAAIQPGPGGLVITTTQKKAYALDSEMRSDALIADVLFGSGAGLAAMGVLFFFLGAPSDSVALLPTFNGFAVAGHF